MYTEGLKTLKELFRSKYVNDWMDLIDLIYHTSEECWHANLTNILRKNITIKYLLVCEAPPFNETNDAKKVKYFYNPHNTTVPQSYIEAVFNAFYPDSKEYNVIYSAETKHNKLNRIAEKGFLLVDSLPYALDYSEPKNVRDRAAYRNLVKISVNTYFLDKLQNAQIPWAHDEVKVAFGLWRNAKEVMKNWPTILPFKCHVKPETRKMPPFDQVAVNGSWNLSEKELRRIYRLDSED